MVIIVPLLALLLAPGIVRAQERTAIITTTDSAGTVTHYDPSKWQLVPVGSEHKTSSKKRECKPETKIEEKIVEKVVEKIVEKNVEVPTYKPNTISILAGYGPIGLATVKGAEAGQEVFEVTKEFGPLAGLRYTRHMDEEWSASIEAMTNYSGVLGVGYSW